MAESTGHPTEESKALAAALGRIPSGLFVLSIRHGEHETAMLASWVQQCSFDPPLVSVAVNARRWWLEWLNEGASISLSILGEGEKQLLAHFGKGFEKDQLAFEGIDVERIANHPPTLQAAHAVLTGRVRSVHPVGDHLLVVAEVEHGRVQHDGRPAVHVRRSGLHY